MWELLIKAIKDNDMVELDRLLSLMTKEDFSNLEDYKTKEFEHIPLHVAASLGNVEAVKKLLAMTDSEVAGKIVSRENVSALHRAVEGGHTKVVDLLLSKNPQVVVHLYPYSQHHKFDTGTALNLAVRRQHDEIVEKLLPLMNLSLIKEFSHGVGHNKSGTALELTNGRAIAGAFSPEMIISTLEYRKDISFIKDVPKKASDSLHMLIQKEPNVADHYYKRGNILFSLNRKEEGKNYYEKAVKLDTKYLEKLIINMSTLENKVNVEIQDGYNKVIAGLIDQVDTKIINTADQNGKTMLYRIAELGKIKAGELLISKIQSQVVRQTVYKAAKDGNQKVLEFLVNIVSKEDLEAANNNGQTILHLAVHHDLDKAVEILLKKMAPESIAKADKTGKKAWDLSTNNKMTEILCNQLGDTAKINRFADKPNKKEVSNSMDIDNTSNDQNTGINQAKLPLATTFSAEKTNLIIANKKAKAELEKATLNNQVKKQTITSSTSSSTTDNTSKKETTINDKTKSLNKVPVVYSNERINKLLNCLEKQEISTSLIDLEAGKLAKDRIEYLVKPVMEEGKTASIALHLRGESWASLVIKKQGDNLQVIYNDPRGNGIKDEKNVKSLINTIKNLEEVSISTFDLMVKQQIVDNDSAPFVIDNLINLAKIDTSSMKKPVIQKLLSEQDQVNNIKQNHLIMQDINPWYSVDKLDKLLHLKLYNKKQISIAPSIEFERKELLVENISVAAKEVMDSNKIAVMPIHLHNNHWTALVIKKQADGSLQILYNDPKGNSLMSEKNSGALLKAISKVNAEFTLVDIRLKQQDNDDDCGPYTIENLVKLAKEDTSHLHKDQLQKLLQINNNIGNEALSIRIEQATELEKAGIPVPPPRCNNNNFADKSELYSDFDVQNTDTTETGFMPPSPIAEGHELEAIGVSTNY